MTYKELRLSVAKGIAAFNTETPWYELPETTRRLYLRDADAALSAIRKTGVRLMPREATKEMKSAAWKAAELTSRQSEWAYTAMSDAGEIKPETKHLRDMSSAEIREHLFGKKPEEGDGL